MELQTTIFDYDSLAIEDREFVKGKELSIKARTSQTIWENGRDLLEVKERLEHGQFQEWVDANFPWSIDTAENMISVCKKFENPKISDYGFSKSVMYLLAKNNTPESARQEAVDLAEQGETVTHKEAKELVEAHKVIAGLESKLQSLQSQLPTEDVLNRIADLEAMLEDAKNKPTKDPQLEEDLRQAQLRARALEESLLEAENKPAQLVEKIVKVKDEKALEKLQREKRTYQEKANAMTHELATYERRIKELQSQMEVDNPRNIDVATAKEIRSHMRRVELDIRLAVTDAINIGGYMEETKAALKAVIDSLTETHNLIESHKMIEIG